MQNEFVIDAMAANNDCMTCVMTALITRDDVEMRRQEIDDLAFSFVSPLRADDRKVHVFQYGFVIIPFCFPDIARLTPQPARRRQRHWQVDRSGARRGPLRRTGLVLSSPSIH